MQSSIGDVESLIFSIVIFLDYVILSGSFNYLLAEDLSVVSTTSSEGHCVNLFVVSYSVTSHCSYGGSIYTMGMGKCYTPGPFIVLDSQLLKL